jgi:hypothetical protein
MQFIKDLIKEYKSTIYWTALVNVILVFYDARDSFLYESTNFKNDTKFIFSLVKKFNKHFDNLKITSDQFKYPRFFVYKKNSWVDKDIIKNPDNLVNNFSIAKYLGFTCKGHDFSNFYVPRIYVRYILNDGSNIISEVCEINKISKKQLEQIANDKSKSFNNVLNQYDVNVTFSVNIDDGVNLRMEKLLQNDQKYILENIDEYDNDLANHYLADNWEKSLTFKYLINSETNIDEKLLKVLNIIYKYIKNGLFDTVFENFSLDEAQDRILEFDNCIWEHIEKCNINDSKCIDKVSISKGGSIKKQKSIKKYKKKKL